MPQNNQYLIISQSGRALAASAKLAGMDVHVIDLFADEDTVEHSFSNYSIIGFSGDNNAEQLIDLVDEYVNIHPELSIVIGSGFEDSLNVLATLEQRFSVIGNHSSIQRQLKDPEVFFKKLAQLSLPYPEYFSNRQGLSNNLFLKKNIGGAGGGHISLDKKGLELTSNNYLQAFLEGKSYSATFLAGGKSFYVLGFNETWVCNKNTDFAFAGAVSNADLPDELCHQVTDAIRQLVSLFQLRGLCGLDFIVEETGQYSILEVNPRPTVTFQLYETQEGLFAQHLAAFQEEMAEPELDQNLSHALGLLYAEKSMTIPCLDWPTWVTDRPRPGKVIAKGEPVCTVHAAGSNAKNAQEQLIEHLALQRGSLGLPA